MTSPEPGAADRAEAALTSIRAGLDAASRRGLRRAKLLVGDYPALLPVYLRLTPEGTDRNITDRTQLVVEGFPRSGTTFAAKAITMAQGPDFVLTNHVHTTGILEVARQREVPTLVVVRHPVDCLASYLVWDPVIGTKTVLWEYLHYHKALADLAPHFVIASFDQVTIDLPAVARRVTERFDIELATPEPSADFERRVRDAIRDDHARFHPSREPGTGVPVPDESRRAALEGWKERLQQADLAERLDRALRLYDELRRFATPRPASCS